jgi:cytochrome P450
MELNPFDHRFQSNPYPTYAWLRENAPVYRNDRLDFWALSRFDDVLEALHDTATYTSTKGVALEDDGQGAAKSMIHMDPPDHTQMRKLVSRRFAPRRCGRGPASWWRRSPAVTRSTWSPTTPRCSPRW